MKSTSWVNGVKEVKHPYHLGNSIQVTVTIIVLASTRVILILVRNFNDVGLMELQARATEIS